MFLRDAQTHLDADSLFFSDGTHKKSMGEETGT